jgi:hypothetical protein
MQAASTVDRVSLLAMMICRSRMTNSGQRIQANKLIMNPYIRWIEEVECQEFKRVITTSMNVSKSTKQGGKVK